MVLILTLVSETETESEGPYNKTDDLAVSNGAYEGTKAAEEVALMSEVALKARLEEYDDESTITRHAKMEISRRQALFRQVYQAVKVNSKLETNFKDPQQKGDIAGVEDRKNTENSIGNG